MIRQVRIEIGIFLCICIGLLIALTCVQNYNPRVVDRIEYQNVTIPCPVQDCRAEVLQVKLNCLEDNQEKEELIKDDICVIESNKPQWCPQERCSDDMYCDMPMNSVQGECVKRLC